MTSLPYIYLALLWMGFCVLHSLLAALSVKDKVEKNFPSFAPYYRLGYNIFFTVFLVAILLYQLSLPQPRLWALPSWLVSLSYPLILTGLLIMILAIRHYPLGEFLGFEQLRADSSPTPSHSPPRLSTSGLNGIVRHPLYFGTLVFALGLLLREFSPANLIVLIIFTVYLVIGIKLEEKKLVMVFGEEYRAYQKRVKRLVPFVY